MRAARLHELGGVPRVDDVDAPEGPNVVAVAAAGLNPVDVAIGSGRFYGGSPQTPYVGGSGAGGHPPRRPGGLVRAEGGAAPPGGGAPGATVEIPGGSRAPPPPPRGAAG